ncbi:hypothetical protein A2U01_0104254, partial [Trifolium medium]|nr:hypothetical protein [Trifolium medium]
MVWTEGERDLVERDPASERDEDGGGSGCGGGRWRTLACSRSATRLTMLSVVLTAGDGRRKDGSNRRR